MLYFDDFEMVEFFFFREITKIHIFLQVGCCGADGSDDFINAKKPVPTECRDMVTGCEYS